MLLSEAQGPRSKEEMRQLTYLLQDELLVLWGCFLTEMHDENIRSCLHSYAGLWLMGVIANFSLGCVLKKLKMEQPTGVSYPLMWREGNHWMRTRGYESMAQRSLTFPSPTNNGLTGWPPACPHSNPHTLVWHLESANRGTLSCAHLGC